MISRLALLLTFVAFDARAAEAGFAALDTYVEQQMAAHGIPGLALAIIQDGGVVHARGFGDGVTPRTPFVIGSLSKAFTAIAVMQQVEAGRLQLDAPVRRYLPEFALADEAAAAGLTLRHLLHHTSGLPAIAGTAKNEGFTLAQHVAALGRVAPLEAAGTRYRYASSNYQVLGLLVEKVSNEPFAAYVQRHIFEPLEMASSFTSRDAAREHGLTPGHRLLAGIAATAELAEEPGRLPTAALISSAEDLARLLTALMGTHASANVLLRPTSRSAILEPGPIAADGFTYAMGWRVGPTADVPSHWHGGALPNYRAAIAFSPSERWGVIVLTNLGSHAVDHTRAIAKGLTAQLHGKPPPAPGQPLKRISALLAVAVAVPNVLAVWKLWRVRRWKPRGSRRRLLVTQALAILFSGSTALVLPALLGIPLWAIYESAPDLVFAVALLLVLNSALAAVRLRKVLATAA